MLRFRTHDVACCQATKIALGRRKSLAIFRKKNSEQYDKPCDYFLSILSDQCGVKYTSTAKTVLSKSAAEEKMTTEAIKDVYWHGLNSQQPAHYFDPTVSDTICL